MWPRHPGPATATLLLGAFDPPTNAHVEIVLAAGAKTGQPPAFCVTKDLLAREASQLLSVADRNSVLLEVAERVDAGLAFASSGRYIDVARTLRADGFDARFVIGSDKLAQLSDPAFYEDGERGVDATFREVSFVVVPRAGVPIDVAGADVVELAGSSASISATQVRRRWREGKPVDHLVPPEVARRLSAG